MIKVEKSQALVPQSLIPAYTDLFPEGQGIPTVSKNTHIKRMEIIALGSYVNKDGFNSLYKRDDIKNGLINIYKNKCAFCEQRVEQYHIEHYRPKKIYYWLAFSWDNLILACATCNQNKGTNFELSGIKAEFQNNEDNIKSINNLSASYDLIEQPKMVNPEITDPLDLIKFTQNGMIYSDDDRFTYTIKTCQIDRSDLNDERRKLLDIYKRDVQSALIENDDLDKQEHAIVTITKKFLRDSKDLELQFLAFRRFAINAGWLNDLSKQLN
jgi:uncharacterized protein (TIGR02646 family)